MAKKPGSSAKVGNLKIDYQTGSTGELVATWTWNYSHTKEFNCKWEYHVGTKANGKTIWFSASASTTDASHKNSLYSPPENAKGVRFSVKPISTTYKKNNKDTNYWTISSYTKATFKLKTEVVKLKFDTPPTPSVSLSADRLTVSIANYETNSDPSLSASAKIHFELSYINIVGMKGIDSSLSLGHSNAVFEVLPNQSVQVRCKAIPYDTALYEESDYSSWSSATFTLPITPIIENIRAISQTGVSIKLKNGTLATSYEVQYSEDYAALYGTVGSESVYSKTFDNITSNTNWVEVTGLETGKHWYFKIRGANDGGSTAFSSIVDVILGQAPNAPTIWSSSYALGENEEVVLYWTHNSLDGSKEVNAILNFRISYVNKNTGNIDTQVLAEEVVPNISKDPEKTTFSYRFDPTKKMPGVQVTKLTWKCKTKGISPNYSPYSITNDIDFYIKPEVELRFAQKNEWYWDSLDLEDGNIYETIGELKGYYDQNPFIMKSFPLYVLATVYPINEAVRPIDSYFSIYADETYETLDYMGNTSWVMEGEEVYRHSMASPNLQNNTYMFWILPSDVVLENGISYRFHARVITDVGMIAEEEWRFIVDFQEDNVVLNAETSYDPENVSIYVEPYCETEEGEPYLDGMYLSVFRQNYDGQFTEIAKNLEAIRGTTVIDPHPTLRYVKYRIAVMSINGTMSFTDLAGIPVPETAIVLQWDETWSEFDLFEADSFSEPVQKLSMLKLPFNVDTSEDNQVDSELVQYIGRKNPVAYYGTQVGQKMSLATDVVATDTDTIYQLRRLAIWLGNVYVREPTGHGYWAKVDVSFSKTHLDVKIPVKITCTRVEGGI